MVPYGTPPLPKSCQSQVNFKCNGGLTTSRSANYLVVFADLEPKEAF